MRAGTCGVRNAGWLALLGALMAGCLTDEGGVVVPASLAKEAAADGQEAPAGGRLAMPLRVTVRGEDGAGIVRVGVRWDVVGGPSGASLSDTLTLTNGVGDARVELTLGSEPGTYTVRASLESNPQLAVTFAATALPLPQITGVAPSSFTSGDTLDVSGSSFTGATTFQVAGVPAVAVSVAAGGTSARIVVPPCLPVGVVEVRALLQGVPGVPFAGSYAASSDPIMLAVGQYVSIGAEEVAGCARIPGGGASGAEYLVAPQLATAVAGDTASYRIRNGGPAMSGDAGGGPGRLPRAVAFHDYLRQWEGRIPPARAPVVDREATGEPSATILVGQRRDFVVCSVIDCSDVDDFAPVRAVARFVGRHAAIFVDEEAPENGFTDGDFQALGRVFDEQLYDVDTRAFGADSDIDGNRLVLILMTPVVNALTPKERCSESFVTGFFFAIDISPIFARDPRSNQAEIFYSFVPDPSGSVTCDHSVDRVRQTVPVTFVHEFQHMISYNQHVLLRGGRVEELWLNEAMSHLAEELAAFRFRDLGDTPNFNRFALGNITNAYKYLLDPGAEFVLSVAGTGTLEERGAAWLLLRYLVDQHGPDLTRRLSETGLKGTANVEEATGMAMSALLPQWLLANWVSDLLPESIEIPELRYTTWAFRTTYESLNEQSPNFFTLPFPLVPELFADGVGFDRLGVLRAGSGDYYRVVQSPGAGGIALEFTRRNGQPLTNATGARLNIVRVN